MVVSLISVTVAIAAKDSADATQDSEQEAVASEYSAYPTVDHKASKDGGYSNYESYVSRPFPSFNRLLNHLN